MRSRARLWIAAASGAVVPPLLIATAIVVVSARGALVIGASLVALAVAVAVVTAIAMWKRDKRSAIPMVATYGVLVLFATTWCSSPLPVATLGVDALPAATPPAEMAIHQMPTGVVRRTAAFAYRGGSMFDERDFAMTAVLVTHPAGDVLIDTGFGRNIDAQLDAMPFAFRVLTDHAPARPVADQLAATGYDLARLRGILVTHAHWDHVSGAADLAGVPMLLPAAERRFIDGGGWITAVAREVGASYEEYAFDGGAYLGFAASHDIHGDGSIVVVPAPGHTPGSVIVFVSLPDDRRYAFIGDLSWQLEGVLDREERPWLFRLLADDDPAAVRANLARMSAIATRFPTLIVVPAHDARAFATIARLVTALR